MDGYDLFVSLRDELYLPEQHDRTKEVSVIVDEGYGLQISAKVGTTMVNVRAADVEELELLEKNLKDSESEWAQALVASIQEFVDKVAVEPEEKPAPRKTRTARPKPEPEEEADEEDEEEEDEDKPTDVQIRLAKKYGVRNYRNMTGTALKRAISKKKAEL